MRYRLPPDTACTKQPMRSAASGASNSTGHSSVPNCRALRRRAVRSPAMRPTTSAPQQILGGTRSGVPVIALHRIVVLADDRTVDVVARTAISAGESQRIGVDEFRFPARHRRTFAVGDARVDAQRCCFGFAAKFDRVLDRQVPRMIEIEVRPLRGKPRRIGESRRVVFRGKAGNRKRLVDRCAKRFVRKIRRARIAAPFADKHRHANALVAVVADGLDFTFANRDALADGLRNFRLGRDSASGFGRRQNRSGNAFKFSRGNRKAAVSGAAPRNGRGAGCEWPTLSDTVMDGLRLSARRGDRYQVTRPRGLGGIGRL